MKARAWWAVAAMATCGFIPPASADDPDAGENLIRRSQCTACHSLDKKGMYPTWKAIAVRYKGKAGVEDKLYAFLSDRSRIEFNRLYIQHDPIRSTDEAEIRTTIRWILSR